MAETKLAERLARIIGMLNSGKPVKASQLAEKFGVSSKTIRRDLLERLDFMRLQQSGDEWSLEQKNTGALTIDALNGFALACGVQQLFPSLNKSIIQSILNTKSPYLIKPVNYESSLAKQNSKQLFSTLEDAIYNSKEVGFSYKKKNYATVQPYKLVNFQGFWYLAAIHENKLKSFHFGLLINLWATNNTFSPSAEIEQEIIEDDTIWFGEEKYEVVLKLTNNTNDYFKRKQIFPEQEILEELPNGDIFIKTKAVNDKQILPLIKAWIPNIHIISPKTLNQKLKLELSNYIK